MTKREDIKRAIEIAWNAHLDLDHVGQGRYIPCNEDCNDKIKDRITEEILLLVNI